MTILAHRIRLQPRARQESWLVEQSGYQRWCWNQMLARFKQGLANGIWWDSYTLERELRRQRPGWTGDRWSNGITQAARSLDRAVIAWQSKSNPARFPRFHRKRDRVSCSFPGDTVQTDQRRVRIPKLGWVRMRESLRLDGRLCQVAVTREAGSWWVSFVVNTQTKPEPPTGEHVVGVDVGLRSLAVTSDGVVFENPRPLAHALNELQKVNRSISRSVRCHGRGASNRRRRLYRSRARLYGRVGNIRKNAHRQLASAIAKTADTVCVESLNVSGMLKNHKLSRAVSDAGLSKLLSEIAWQCEKRGIRLVEAGQWEPSTRTCSTCGNVKDEMTLGEREYRCAECGLVMDRDLNSAMNLKRVGTTALRGGHGKTRHSEHRPEKRESGAAMPVGVYV